MEKKKSDIVVYCTSILKGDEGFYCVWAFKGDSVLFSLEGSESYTKADRISLIALKEAVVSIQEEGGLIYTDSDYALDYVKGGDHRKNKDVARVMMEAMSRRIQVENVKNSDRRYRELKKELSLR